MLDAALSWDIGMGFRVGARLAFYTGAPLTPFHTEAEIAAAGAKDREHPFARLDVRAEKRWTLGARGWISVVLEGQNVTLSKEPNGLACNGDIGQRPVCSQSILGPVTIPSLGLEGGV